MTLTQKIDMRLVIKDPTLASMFRRYVEAEYSGERGAMTLVVRKALREFLVRELQAKENAVASGH